MEALHVSFRARALVFRVRGLRLRDFFERKPQRLAVYSSQSCFLPRAGWVSLSAARSSEKNAEL